MPVPE